MLEDRKGEGCQEGRGVFPDSEEIPGAWEGVKGQWVWEQQDPCPVTNSSDPSEDGDHNVPSPPKDPQSCKVVLKELRPQDPCTTLGVRGEDPMTV